MPATTLAADSYPTTNGTWNVRAGVGTSIDNPALWMDEANWVDGKIPDGPDLAVADFGVGTSTDVIWVKLPDDRPITVQKLLFVKGGARIRFFGGQGFHFTRTTGATYVQLTDPTKTDKTQAYIGANPGENAPFFFTPIHCEKKTTYFNNVVLAGPLSSGLPNLFFIQWYTVYRADRYAPCGGDVRTIFPNVTGITAGEFHIEAPQNNEAHTGSWAATKGSKMLRWVSGKKGTELAVGQYVHASGVIPEGAYVEYIYDDGHIGLSQAALADSADAEMGTSVDFDRCYYKLTQTFEKWTSANDTTQSAGHINVLRRAEENVCTIDLKAMTAGKVQRFYLNAAAPNGINTFPAPGIVELREASGLGTTELRFAGATYLRLSGDSLASNTVSNLRFNTSTCWGTIDVPTDCEAQAKVNKMFATCKLDKVGAGKLTLNTSLTAATATDFSDKPGVITVREGTLAFAPTQNTTVESLAVEDGAAFAIDGSATVTFKTLDIKSGGTFVWPTNATLNAKNFRVTTGSSIRFEMAVKDDGSVDPYSITDAKYNLANGGEIRLTGDVKKIAAGRHRLVSSSTLGDLGGWTLTGYEGPRTLTLAKDAEGLYLDVKVPGLVLFLK